MSAVDTQTDPRHAQWPAERFYWGVLDLSGLPRAGRGADRGYLLEPLLPVPLESVHAVFASIGQGRVLACAADRDALKQASDDGALSITPATVPDVVGDAGVDPSGLNLLTGDCEPGPLRRLRRAWALSAVAVVALVALVAAVGLFRRAGVQQRVAQHAAESLSDLYGAVLPALPAGSTQDPGLLLAAEADRLSRSRTGAPVEGAPDAAPVLADLLARWPKDVSLRAESITVAPGRITLTALVDDAGDVEPVRRALARVEGWTPSLPRTETTGRGGVRVTLRLTQDGASKETTE